MNGMLLKRLMQQVTPSETQAAQVLARVISRVEADLSDATHRLCGAADVDVTGDPVDADERERELLEVADAVAEGRLAEYYFSEVSELPDGEQAAQYAGMGTGDEWEQQKRDWHLSYYREDVVDNSPSDTDADRTDAVAEKHVRQVWGVPLEVFRAEVLEWSRGAALEAILAGPIQSHTAAVDAVADALEDSDGGGA
jgi:hypothetical protein